MKQLFGVSILVTLFQNRVQYLKILILSNVLNFVLLVTPMVWFIMDLQTGHLEDGDHTRVFFLLFTMKFFWTFFWIDRSKKIFAF